MSSAGCGRGSLRGTAPLKEGRLVDRNEDWKQSRHHKIELTLTDISEVCESHTSQAAETGITKFSADILMSLLP
jgi:hypothetical protein